MTRARLKSAEYINTLCCEAAFVYKLFHGANRTEPNETRQKRFLSSYTQRGYMRTDSRSDMRYDSGFRIVKL